MNSANRIEQLLDFSYYQAYHIVQDKSEDKHFKKIKKDQLSKLAIIIDKIESQKAVVTAIVTSLVKKIEMPEQDIKLHKSMFR